MKDLFFARQWDLTISEMKPVSQRVSVFIQSTRSVYIIKQKQSIEGILAETKLAEHLSGNLPVPLPIKTVHGDYFAEWKGELYCLYPYLDGQTLSAQKSLQSPGLFGQTFAKFHKKTRRFQNGQSSDFYETVYGWAAKTILAKDPSLSKAFFNLEPLLKKASHLPKQLIHRDAHPSNFLFTDSELTGILDLELAEENIRIFDLCYFCTSILYGVYADESLRNEWLAFPGKLLHHYEQENPLQQSELEFIWVVLLGVQALFMADFLSNDSLYECNKDMFLWILEHKEEILAGVREISRV
ncbi:phosphotransferase [Metabacillus sp. GX 13764]|uniref:phosphotransferase enzyme family protein n=1 Tax=Metabacillus kandeliae TaxID=2900151 RepID=UPI001E30680E|nr:phosphotransferase [Metabacillus kandeliae]MCD7034600.1 phosphotransferase [Metabacillus kandeliae]